VADEADLAGFGIEVVEQLHRDAFAHEEGEQRAVADENFGRVVRRAQFNVGRQLGRGGQAPAFQGGGPAQRLARGVGEQRDGLFLARGS